MSQKELDAFDRGLEAVSPSPTEESRRLAIRRCILICLTNGWAPPAETVWRLVELREAVQLGERREDTFTTFSEEEQWRLEFARYLYEHGRIGEDFPRTDQQCSDLSPLPEVEVFNNSTVKE